MQLAIHRRHQVAQRVRPEATRQPMCAKIAKYTAMLLVVLSGLEPHRSCVADTHAIAALQFSPDGTLLAAASASMNPPGPVVLWNVSDWSIASTHRPNAGSLDVDFSRDGSRLAYASKSGAVGIIVASTGELRGEFKAHSGAVFSVAFMPHGNSLFSAGADHKIHLWDATTFELKATFDSHTDTVDGVAVSPDGALLLSGGSDEQLLMWDIESRQVLQTFRPSDLIVRRVSFSRDGNYFLASRWDGKVRMRDTRTGQLLARISSGSDCADLSDDQRLVVTTGYGSTAHVYPVTLRDATREEQDEVDSLFEVFESGTYDQREAASQRIRELGMIAEPQLRVAMQSDNAEVRVRARSLRELVLSPEPIAELPGHIGDVEVVDFSPDGKLLASACRGGDIKIWDAATFKEIRTLRISTNPIVPGGK